MPPICRSLLVAVLAALPAPVALSQAAPAPRESSITEEIDVRRIEFSLLVRDANGKPVQGLTPDELAVRLAGRDVPIVYMEPVIRTDVPDEPAPHVRLKLDVGTVAESARSEPTPPNYFLFFIDTEPGTLPLGESTIDSLSRFVRETVRAQDLAAVVSYGEEVRLETPFTNDREQLAAAVANAYENRRAKQINVRTRVERLTRNLETCIQDQEVQGFGGAGRLSRGTVEPSLSDPSSLNPVIGCVEILAASYVNEMTPQIQSYLGALEATLQLSRGLNGNLTVYAVSHGVEVEPLRSFTEAMEAVFGANANAVELQSRLGGSLSLERVIDRAAQMAKRERASFFFIDPTLPPSGLAGARQQAFYQVTARPVEMAHEAAQDLPKLVASETGGMFIEERDVLAGLRQSFELQKGRYILGIDAASVPPGDDLKKLRIACSRPGVRVTHSRGIYMEGRDGDALDARIAVLPARTAAQAAAAETPGDAADGRPTLKRGFAIGLDAADLRYLEEGDEVATELTLHLQVQTLEGRHLVGMFHQLRHALPRLTHETDPTKRIVSIRGTLEAPPGAYRLLAFVRNPTSDRETLIFREIEIPDAMTSRLRGAP